MVPVLRRRGRSPLGVAQENPIGLALGSVAVGFVAGMLVPSTRVEDERLGPMADEVKERAKETGQRGPRARQGGSPGRRPERQGNRSRKRPAAGPAAARQRRAEGAEGQ